MSDAPRLFRCSGEGCDRMVEGRPRESAGLIVPSPWFGNRVGERQVALCDTCAAKPRALERVVARLLAALNRTGGATSL
jgi:hypothetical protein